MRFSIIVGSLLAVLCTEAVMAEEVNSRNVIVARPSSVGQYKRSPESVRDVFSRNSSFLFQAYKEALGRNPRIAGVVKVRLVIEPDGTVSDCVATTSELNDAILEEKMVILIKKFDFGGGNFAQWKGVFPINLYPD